MLDDQEKQENYTNSPFSRGSEENGSGNNSKIIGFVILGVIILAVLTGVFFYLSWPAKKAPVTTGPINPGTPASSTAGILPGDMGDGDDGGNGNGSSTVDIKAETISFGDFYKPYKDNFRSEYVGIDYPINIKSDVINYYDMSRKMDLDPYVEELNKNGFAVIDNQWPKEANDFYSVYQLLDKKEIPIVVTSDFVMYYFQNELKLVNKEIEKSVFFENVWDINKTLYLIALNRYKRHLGEIGPINDPVLEAERLETAYFAVALKLLMPDLEQIDSNANLADASKFPPEEASNYYFDLPEELEKSVDLEVALIRGAKQKTKSPVLLYNRNYQDFRVPGNYKNNAKLNNFYVVMKWLNTVFPFYYQDENCPNCLLDFNDWLINMTAASLITRDLSDNQELKNQWAIVYKFISFFSGLRSDLTYLDYYGVYSNIFGKDFDPTKIFSKENTDRKIEIKKIQNKLAAVNFTAIEGNYDRDNPETRPLLGMRILQESYWPNDYFFKELTGRDLVLQNNTKTSSRVTTSCGGKEGSFRCKGISYDILNLLTDVKTNSNYYFDNTNYSNYDRRIGLLRQELDTFDKYTWNNNIYWATLGIVKRILRYDTSRLPSYVLSSGWQDKKDYNTALGSWVNIHLPADVLESNEKKKITESLGADQECNVYNFIEPYLPLYNELIARNNMLQEILSALKVVDRTNAAAIKLKELNSGIDQLNDIIKKELSREALTFEDCKYISNFTQDYKISISGSRDFRINFPLSNNYLKESIKGVKLIVLIYNLDGNKIMAVGPVFNYQELAR